MKITQNFDLEEFVPKEVYETFGEKSVWFLDPRLPVLVQKIRDLIDKSIIINNWNTGGQNNYCGFRQRKCEVGAENSQHRFGRAADLHIEGIQPTEVRQFIRDYYSVLNPLGLTTIEMDTPTWTHIDLRWSNSKILIEVPFQ